MLQKMRNNAVLCLVIGITLIVLGILFVFVMPDIGESIKNIAIGIMILIIVILMIFPELADPKSKLLFNLYVIELVLAILIAVMFATTAGENPSLWIGLVLFIHGVVELIGGYFSRERQNAIRFFLALVLVSVGVFIFASNLITNDMLLTVLLVIFLAPGLFFLLMGILNLKNNRKQAIKA